MKSTKSITKMLSLRTVLFLVLISGIYFNANAGMVSPGEELLYEVSFLGIKLGSIKMIVEGYEVTAGHETVKAKAFMDSYKGIPFVDLHTIFETWFDPSVNYSYKFVGHQKENNIWLYDHIHFDYDKGRVSIEKWKEKQKFFGTVIKTKKHWHDGASLFYFARQYLKSQKNYRVPTIMDRDTAFTLIYFSPKRENIEIDAVGYPIRTVYFSGKTEWTGIYGLNGTFEGWFSDDDACVPVLAKLNVYVGSVKVKLISWKRNGWTPPRGY